MDPIEKKFQEAFADYQLPVDDGLWDQVLEKKNKRKPFPWMRLAAALAFLVVAGFLIWPSSTEERAMTGQVSAMVTEPGVTNHDSSTSNPRMVQEHHPELASLASAQQPLVVTPGFVTQQVVHSEVSEVAVHEPEVALVNDPEALDPVELLPAKATSRPAPAANMDRVPLPNSIHIMQAAHPVYAANPIKKGISTVKHDLESPDDLTGPARLVGTLQKASPKLFKDILAFSTAESTEIEINW